MIRVRKPAEPPDVLVQAGGAAVETLCRRIEQGDGQRLEFEKAIYGAPAVKEALASAQHGKCCFCESKIKHIASGDVEHFRPKAACRSSTNVPQRKPGYYWLAYEWSNLYFACEQCNRRHKRNLFPLEDENARVVSHHDAARLVAERPLYIDPGHEDPEEHIGFRREYAKPRNGSQRGEIGIADLGLNRVPLCSVRRDRRALLLTLLRNVRNWLSSGCPEGQRSLTVGNVEHVLGSMHDDAEYAAMSRALVREAIPGAWFRRTLLRRSCWRSSRTTPTLVVGSLSPRTNPAPSVPREPPQHPPRYTRRPLLPHAPRRQRTSIHTSR